MSAYSDFFTRAAGNAPYVYQARLAEAPCESRLINIPTGLGKTTADARASCSTQP